MEPVGHHQLDAIRLAGGDHFLTFVGGDGHRLLAQDVNAGARSSNRVLSVHRVRQRDIHCVDLLETLLVLLVRVAWNPILPRQEPLLRGVVTDQRGEHRVAPGMPERRQDGHLSDVSHADDCVPNLRGCPLLSRAHHDASAETVQAACCLHALSLRMTSPNRARMTSQERKRTNG